MDKTVFIISDLHLGKGDLFDIFSGPNKASMLCSFITHCDVTGRSTELVINGDFLDFLQLRPWDTTDIAAAQMKVTEILAANEPIFHALNIFTSRPSNQLTVLIGNHDVELAYPEVRERVIDSISKSDERLLERINLFNNRITYNPVVNGVQVHIEHGNRGDAWNTIDYSAVFRDTEIGTRDFSYPPGTKFVYEVINVFKEHFRFVDLLKPEVPAVPLLLLALKPQMVARTLPPTCTNLLRALQNGLVSKLREQMFGLPLGPDAYYPGASSRIPVAKPSEDWVPALGDDWPEARVVEHFLNSSDAPPAFGPLSLGIYSNAIKLRFLSLALRGLCRFASDEEADDYYLNDHGETMAARGAKSCFQGRVKLVVFGHTHEALKAEFEKGVYVNSGTWANLVKLPRGTDTALLDWYDMIASNSFEVFSKPTYVCVDPTLPNGVNVSLNLWTDQGPKVLWQRYLNSD
jgi:UDP-2,3-diacylglucosamine pyrophosphatase LpxH